MNSTPQPDVGTNAECDSSLVAAVESPAITAPQRGWDRPLAAPTTLVLLRHGVTAHTATKRFSGGLGGQNPPLSADGREQVRHSAQWLGEIGVSIDVAVASPVQRTRQSAEIAAELLDVPLSFEPDFAEMEFGRWDGLTFAEANDRFPDEVDRWMGQVDVAPSGGESIIDVDRRVRAGLDRLLDTHRSSTVLVVSHVTPIKALVARALGAPISSVFGLELAPASISVISFYDDGNDGSGRGVLRLFNALPPARAAQIGLGSRW